MADPVSGPVLEVGGSKQTSHASTLPAECVVIDLSKLPNPYTVLAKGLLQRQPQAIIDWILLADGRARAVMDRVVPQAAGELAAGRSVRLQCYGGRDRSQAVAWHVLQSLDPATRAGVELRVLDADPMPGL
jgi:RNase adaptor protein for sRNA GlmZ degradation